MAQLLSSGGGMGDYLPHPSPTSKPPIGMLECNGDEINPINQPILHSLYGANLPDLRGVAIRGWDNGRGLDKNRELLSYQQDAFGQHGHNISGFDYGTKQASQFDYGSKQSSNFDYGWKNTSAFNYGRKWTNTIPDHNHGVLTPGGGQWGSYFDYSVRQGNTTERKTSLAGGHNHWVDIGEHSHSLYVGAHGHSTNIGPHGHTVIIGAHTHNIGLSGGVETVMKNVAMMYVVKDG